MITLGIRGKLAPKRILLKDSSVNVDGFFEDEKAKLIILVEIYARIGSLKSAQKNKVLGDILKLSFLEKAKAEEWTGYKVRKIVAFADATAASYLSSDSWGAAVARLFGIETNIVQPSIATAEKIKVAQRNQDLRGPVA
jgi:hypothetical protein